MMIHKAIFSWSGGKDSAMCLYRVLKQEEYEVAFLLTTLNQTFMRVSMHGVREELLDAQAKALGFPLKKVWVSEGTNEEYECQMKEMLVQAKGEGIEAVIFGDIFLEDLRMYRERNLEAVGMKAIFPLWKEDTQTLSREFVNLGFRAISCCVQEVPLGEQWAGRELDISFFSGLPNGVDPCGENGEYHSFCYDGPMFAHPVHFRTGEKVFRPIEIKTEDEAIRNKGFWYCDLMP